MLMLRADLTPAYWAICRAGEDPAKNDRSAKILVAQHVAPTFEGKAEALGLRAKSLILLVGAPGLEPGTR